MIGEPVHRTILAIDVEGFTRRPRRDVDRLLMRQELYRLLEQALARAGLRRGDYQNDDRGDGILVLLNAGIPKTRVLPWLVLRLAAELNRYNKTAPETTRLRLRAVVHAGEVASDDHGHASKDLNLTFRLLDSDLYAATWPTPGRASFCWSPARSTTTSSSRATATSTPRRSSRSRLPPKRCTPSHGCMCQDATMRWQRASSPVA
jgi:hypothetical protein